MRRLRSNLLPFKSRCLYVEVLYLNNNQYEGKNYDVASLI